LTIVLFVSSSPLPWFARLVPFPPPSLSPNGLERVLGRRPLGLPYWLEILSSGPHQTCPLAHFGSDQVGLW
jgi:hypothetical protein